MKFIRVIKSNFKTQAAVKDLPQDLVDAINKYTENDFKGVIKELYNRTYKDLNKIELSSDAITTTNKIRTSDLVSAKDKAFFILIDDQSLVLQCPERYPYLIGGEEYFEINGRNVDVSYSPMNLARILNNFPYKAWVIDLSKAEDTRSLRKDRQDSQEGMVRRYRPDEQNSWGDYDLSGYKIDKDRLKKKLRQLRQDNNVYTNKLIELYSQLSSVFNKRMLLPRDKRQYGYKLDQAFKDFLRAVDSAESSYRDPKSIDDDIQRAKETIDKLLADLNNN